MIKIKTEITDKGVIQTLVEETTIPTVTVDQTINRGLSTITTNDMTFFVDDINGSDMNSGLTAVEPFKTIAKAEFLIPDLIKHDVIVQIEPHGGSGYEWPLFDTRNFANNKNIWINFPNFNELVPSTGSLAGSGESLIKSAGLTIDMYVGKTIEILSGDAAGDRRTIRNNTTTDIVAVEKFRAAVSTDDLYRIIEPVSGNVIIPPTDSVMVRGKGISNSTHFTTLSINSGVHIVNAIIKPDSIFYITHDARLFFHGTEISSSGTFMRHQFTGQILIGRDAWGIIKTPFNSSNSAWSGWGATWVGAFPLFKESAGYISGYVVAPRWVTYSGTHHIVGRMVSGPVRAFSDGGYVIKPSYIQFGHSSFSLFPPGMSSMVTNTTETGAAALWARGGATLKVGTETIVESAGPCVEASYYGHIVIWNHITLTTGSSGFLCNSRGNIDFGGTITVGNLTGAELSVGNAPTTGSFASISSAGDFLIESGSSDGSIIARSW